MSCIVRLGVNRVLRSRLKPSATFLKPSFYPPLDARPSGVSQLLRANCQVNGRRSRHEHSRHKGAARAAGAREGHICNAGQGSRIECDKHPVHSGLFSNQIPESDRDNCARNDSSSSDAAEKQIGTGAGTTATASTRTATAAATTAAGATESHNKSNSSSCAAVSQAASQHLVKYIRNTKRQKLNCALSGASMWGCTTLASQPAQRVALWVRLYSS